MPDPDEVKRELSRLAAGDPAEGPDGSSLAVTGEKPNGSRRVGPTVVQSGPADYLDATPTGPDERPSIHRYESVVEVATEAVDHLDRAEAFRLDGGVGRLRHAVERAARAGDRDRLRQGQRALAAYDWFDRAASTDDPPEHDGTESEYERPTRRKSPSRNPYRGPGQNGNT